MDLTDIKHKLSQYLDNRLPGPERGAIENLIQTDPVWKEEYRKMLALAAMAGRFSLEADEKYWRERQQAVVDRIADDEAEKITEVTGPSYRGVLLKLAAVAASIVMVAFVSLYESRDIETTRGIFKAGETETAPLNNIALVPEAVSSNEKDSASLEESAGLNNMPQDISTATAPADVRLAPIDEVKDRGALIPSELNQSETLSDEGVVITNREEIMKLTKLKNESATTKPVTAEIAPERLPPAEEIETPTLQALKSAPSKEKAATKALAPKFEVMAEPQSAPAGTDRDSYYDSATKENTDDNLSEYFRWRLAADSLEGRYFEIVSVHYSEAVAKSRRPAVSSASTAKKEAMETSAESVEESRRTDISADSILHMAQVFYQVGLLTGNSGETSAMRMRLERLAEMADSASADSLSILLQNLESPQK